MDAASWAAENDCTVLERDAFRRRVAAVERLEVIACEPPRDAARLLRWQLSGPLRQYTRWLDILAEVRGDRGGSNAGAADDHRETRSRVAIARLWRALDRLAQDVDLVPAPALLAGLLGHLGHELKLPAERGADAFACWLGERHIDLSELGALLLAHYRFGAIAVEGQLIGLGVEPPADARVVWLLDALRLSGLYARAAALLDADDETRMRLAVLPTSLAQALARDFDNAEPALLRRELLAMSAR
jgi:hypothetical protein